MEVSRSSGEGKKGSLKRKLDDQPIKVKVRAKKGRFTEPHPGEVEILRSIYGEGRYVTT